MDSPTLHHEPESIHSGRSASQYSGYRPQSQYSVRSQSRYSNHSHLNGAELAARGYLNTPLLPGCSSPAPSVCPGSVMGSVASHVYRASRPKTQVPRRSPMRNTSEHQPRSSTPASPCQSVHDAPPELPQPKSRTSLQLHRDYPNTTVRFCPTLPTQSKGGLHPMIAIDRYARKLVIEDKVHSHVYPPVTTEFVW